MVILLYLFSTFESFIRILETKYKKHHVTTKYDSSDLDKTHTDNIQHLITLEILASAVQAILTTYYTKIALASASNRSTQLLASTDPNDSDMIGDLRSQRTAYIAFKQTYSLQYTHAFYDYLKPLI